MMNFEVARHNMIKQQLRTCDIVDEHLLALIDRTPRAHFVPRELEKLAYTDVMLPIGHEQTMFCPRDEGKVLQALQIQTHEKIFEIGTGTGYFTALLAQLGKHVVSVDIFEDFTRAAHEKLMALHIRNVSLETGDAAMGWDVDNTYDVIVVTGGFPFFPRHFLKQLKKGGRLFCIVGQSPVMVASVTTCSGPQTWTQESLFETDVKWLLNVAYEEFRF